MFNLQKILNFSLKKILKITTRWLFNETVCIMNRVNEIRFSNTVLLVRIRKWLIDRQIFHRTRVEKQGALIFNSFNNTVALPECHGQRPWDQEFKFYAISPTPFFLLRLIVHNFFAAAAKLKKGSNAFLRSIL